MQQVTITVSALVLALAGLCGFAVAQLPTTTEKTAAETYGTSADQLSHQAARELLLSLVNQSRVEVGLPKLSLDAQATRLAEGHAQEMARERYLNHHNLAGLKCERRFNEIGGLDYVAENLAYYEIRSPADAALEVFLTPQLVTRIFEHWLASETHRANMLAAPHTQLGAGFALEYSQGTTYVAAALELVTQVGTYQPLPLNARRGDRLLLTGTLAPAAAQLAFIGLGIEPAPVEHDAKYLAEHTSGYSLPRAKYAWQSGQAQPAEAPGAAQLLGNVAYDTETGEFAGEIYLAWHWERGAYYFTVWAEPTVGNTPAFRAMTQVVLVE